MMGAERSLLLQVYSSQRTALSLRIFSHLTSFFSVAVLAIMAHLAATESIIRLVGMLVALAVPFVAVSIVRKIINAPRPYELYDFYESAPKHRHGCSFPSRHAHSAFAIATMCFFFSPILAAALTLCALLMCVCRVLLGIHFIRDVIAGALTGALTSVIGALLIF